MTTPALTETETETETETGSGSLLLRPAAAALSFLTRLPLSPRNLTPTDLGRSVAFFPLAGLLLGAVSAAVALVPVALDPHLRAIAIVALAAYLTGGLHLDGVADVADGLGGGRGDRARTLAIMKDSRIGAFGAIALVLLLLAKVRVTALVAAPATLDTLTTLGPLLVAPVLARALAATAIVAFPYARPDGLGRAFHDHARWYHAAFALAGALALAIGTVPLALPIAAITALTLAAWLHRRLGGLTGDTYGAIIEAAELAALVAASSLAP